MTIFGEKIPYAPVLHVTMLARYCEKLFAPDKTGSGDMNKRGLQIAMALLGVIPVLTGIIGMFGLSDPLYASVGIPANAVLDSNLRFFGGVWFGLGLSLYLLIPNIEKQTFSFRVLWGMIFLGGIGRLASMLFLALPPLPFIGFTVLEIIGAPFFIWWQARLPR